MSEKALQRIRENRKSKSKKLDLSFCDINGALPGQLAELTWLEELNLYGNELYCPSYLENPTQRNQPSPLPYVARQPQALDALASLFALRKLYLGHSRLEDISPIQGLFSRPLKSI